MKQTKKLTVCRLIFEFHPRIGGSIVHTTELSEHINPHCKRQFLVVPRSASDTTELDKSFPFEVYRVNYLRLKWLHRLKAKYFKWLPLAPLMVLSYGFFALPKIFRLNRKYGIDIIHAHGIFAGITATVAGKILRKPSVWMMHGTEEPFRETAGKCESSLARMLVRIFKPDHVLVLDDGTGAPSKFKGLLGSDKVTVVYHGIDTQRFRPERVDKKLLDVPGLGNKFVIVSTQRLGYLKDVEYAILAFSEFLKTGHHEDAIFLVIGEGTSRKKLEELASGLGLGEKVLFLGEVDNSQIPKYLSIADIVLSTSLYSNVSRSVQEAMACAKPVVVFDSGGTSKLIQDRETGLLAKSGNAKDLAEKMALLYKSPELRAEIGGKARQFIQQNRSWESRVSLELAVYRRLLSKKRKS
jgi:glycosyltransferase involved in cell wall biosynthesis